MEGVLFLCHRLPYPPDKGDKIRSYHVLRHLSKSYRVYLGTFVDSPEDWAHAQAVTDLCAEVCIRPLTTARIIMRSAGALLRSEAITARCYQDQVMWRWVEKIVSAGLVSRAVAFSSGMAPFVMQASGVRRIMDFVDVDSEKWRQYASIRSGLIRWLYRREGLRLAAYEGRIAERFDASIFVSPAEAGLFQNRTDGNAGQIYAVGNGVDTDYWDPSRRYPNPYRGGEKAIVFAGAMSYWANAQAAEWFVNQVWPAILRQQPRARFYVVGSDPGRRVRALMNGYNGVTVTGRVSDVRPYVAHAHAVAAPLRVARGVQNKVLEALAMGKVLLATPGAYQGLEHFAGYRGCVTDSGETMATEAMDVLQAAQPAYVPEARRHVLARYQWDALLGVYDAVLRNARAADINAVRRERFVADGTDRA